MRERTKEAIQALKDSEVSMLPVIAVAINDGKRGRGWAI